MLIVAGLWVGAWWLQNYVSSWIWLRNLLRSEPLHIGAHLILYGSCYSFLRRATAGHPRSVIIASVATLFVGCVQESIQCLTYGRAWGKGEVFDISVDAAALLWAEAYWHSKLHREPNIAQ